MIADRLEPTIDLLTEEYVLVQAWKKTSSYIRYHNWYSDTLELDRAAVNLPHFLAQLAEQLKHPEFWNNDEIRIVPAPKSQRWHIPKATQLWEPVEKRQTAAKLRPLAHVSLKDQVAATAVMLCLADRVETIQGDTRDSISSSDVRKRVVSYGNRLFCDAREGELRHRWGSGKLYRAYYEDYRTFLSRSEISDDPVANSNENRVLIVHSDLSRFYDRVRPALLAEKIRAIIKPSDDPSFFSLTDRLLNWTWHRRDSREVEAYATRRNFLTFRQSPYRKDLLHRGSSQTLFCSTLIKH